MLMGINASVSVSFSGWHLLCSDYHHTLSLVLGYHRFAELKNSRLKQVHWRDWVLGIKSPGDWLWGLGGGVCNEGMNYNITIKGVILSEWITMLPLNTGRKPTTRHKQGNLDCAGLSWWWYIITCGPCITFSGLVMGMKNITEDIKADINKLEWLLIAGTGLIIERLFRLKKFASLYALTIIIEYRSSDFKPIRTYQIRS